MLFLILILIWKPSGKPTTQHVQCISIKYYINRYMYAYIYIYMNSIIQGWSKPIVWLFTWHTDAIWFEEASSSLDA